MRTEVLDHDVKFAVGIRRCDCLHEPEEFLGSAMLIAFSDDAAGRDIQRTEQVDDVHPGALEEFEELGLGQRGAPPTLQGGVVAII